MSEKNNPENKFMNKIYTIKNYVKFSFWASVFQIFSSLNYQDVDTKWYKPPKWLSVLFLSNMFWVRKRNV